jgi:hypothetical protein
VREASVVSYMEDITLLDSGLCVNNWDQVNTAKWDDLHAPSSGSASC